MSLLKLAVEAHKAREQERVVKGLAAEGGAPVPRAGEAPVDAGPCREEVVRPAPIEGVLEKVREDGHGQVMQGAELRVHVLLRVCVCVCVLYVHMYAYVYVHVFRST